MKDEEQSVSAVATVVYGVSFVAPENVCWPSVLKRLEEMKGVESLGKLAARAIPSSTELAKTLPESIAHYAKVNKSILVAPDGNAKQSSWESPISMTVWLI